MHSGRARIVQCRTRHRPPDPQLQLHQQIVRAVIKEQDVPKRRYLLPAAAAALCGTC
jgi:hypothetical protein